MIKTQPPTKNLAMNYGYRGIMFTRNMIYDSPMVKSYLYLPVKYSNQWHIKKLLKGEMNGKIRDEMVIGEF